MTKTIRKHYRFDEETEKLLKQNLNDTNTGLKKKMTESEYLRDLIRRDKVEKLGISKNDIIDMKRILAGIGNNINQIAHHLNSGLYDMYDIDNLKQCMEDISKIKEFVNEI